MKRKDMEVRISGFGGQGVILAAHILGKAAALYEEKNATMTQSFGPEARGSACSAQVILSEKQVLYPYVRNVDVLVAMSQEAYSKFLPQLKDKGVLLIDEDLVFPEKGTEKRYTLQRIPATRLAESLGRKIVLNIVILGFFTAVTKLVGREAMRKAIETSVPKGTEKMNLKAFDTGYNYFSEKASG